MHYPSRQEMNNDNNSLKTHLLILRCMCTSDFTHHFALYDSRTIKGMVHQARTHYEFCRTDPYIASWFKEALTDIEREEYNMLCLMLEQYVTEEEVRESVHAKDLH